MPSVVAFVVKRTTGVKYIFDMRGFWADERVDGGLWKSGGLMYKIAKYFEKQFLLDADHVVTLTHKAKQEINNFKYLNGLSKKITVIPTCADLKLFAPNPRKKDEDFFTLGYVGSAGTWYSFDMVVACFANLLQIKPKAHLLIINRGQHTYIKAELCKVGIPDSSYEIIAAYHDDVPVHMARMDAGIFFYRPSYSRLACAPTKLAEFLGCGIPCITNFGVGDMDFVLQKERVGIVLKKFDTTTMSNGLAELLQLFSNPDTHNNCVATAHKYFSLDEGVSKYRKIYEELAK